MHLCKAVRSLYMGGRVLEPYALVILLLYMMTWGGGAEGPPFLFMVLNG